MSKQVYVLCDFGAPRAVFTRRDNAEAMVAEFGCGTKCVPLPLIDSDGTAVPIVPDDYKKEVEDDGADA